MDYRDSKYTTELHGSVYRYASTLHKSESSLLRQVCDAGNVNSCFGLEQHTYMYFFKIVSSDCDRPVIKCYVYK